MSTEESAPVAEAIQTARRRGLGPGFVTLLGLARARVRQGELGPLPVVVGLAIIWTFFYLQEPQFLSARNLSNLILQIAVTGTIAIGVVLVLLLGEIDLSVGSVAGVTAATLGVIVSLNHSPWWFGIIAMLAVGALIGAFQGFWFARVGVPSFVVTLAGLLAILGIQLHVLGSQGTLNVVEPHILAITSSYLTPEQGWLLAIGLSVLYGLTQFLGRMQRERAGLSSISVPELAIRTLGLILISFIAVAALNAYQGVPTAGVVLLTLVLVFSWITTRTRFGRHIYAVGGNPEAARRAGISVPNIRIAVFTLSSLLAAMGGLLAVSRNEAAGTLTGGGTLLLEAIAAAVIGGTSLFGGRGSVWAALLGALVIGSVSNGLDLTGAPADIKYIVQGAILLLAVTIDAISRRGRAAAGRA